MISGVKKNNNKKGEIFGLWVVVGGGGIRGCNCPLSRPPEGRLEVNSMNLIGAAFWLIVVLRQLKNII